MAENAVVAVVAAENVAVAEVAAENTAVDCREFCCVLGNNWQHDQCEGKNYRLVDHQSSANFDNAVPLIY